MKRGRKLIILVIALAVVIAACLLVINLTPKDTAVTDEDTQTVICAVNTDNVSGLAWDYNGESLSFTNSDGEWTYDEDGDFPSDNTSLNMMADAISEVTSSKTIEAPEDLSEYGLDEPTASVKVTVSAGSDETSADTEDTASSDETESAAADTDTASEETSEAADTAGTESAADSKVIELSFGDTTSLTGEVYCSIGDGNVYLVDASIPESFECGLYDVVKSESIPAMNDIESVYTTASAGNLQIEYHPDEDLAYSNEYVWFNNDDGTMETLDTDLTETYISTITGLSWLSCVNYKADDEALAEYGLDEPDVAVDIKYLTSVEVETNETDDDGNPVTETQESEEEFKLEMSQGQNGSYYARIAGSQMVYTIDSTVYDTMTYTTYYELQPDEVLVMNWDDVNKIDVTLDGETYTLEKVTRVVEAETETAEEDGDTAESSEAAEEDSEIETITAATAESSEAAETTTAAETTAAAESTSEADGETSTEAAEAEYETVWTMNGQDVAVDDILDSLTSMTSTGYANGTEPEHDAEISFVIYRDTDAFSEVELTFYGHSSTSCLTQLDGKSTVFVNREDIVNLVESVKTQLVY